jgi:hypothetical protein
MDNPALEDDAERIITYFSAGSTGFTEFKINPDGEGEYYEISAGEETAYEFELDEDQVEEYRDRLWDNLTSETAVEKEYSSRAPQVAVYREGEHQKGRPTREGKVVINEILNALDEY